MVDEPNLTQQLVCQSCGESFPYPEAERLRDERAAYPPPRRCPRCLQESRAAGAAKRAAKRPKHRRR